MVLAAPGDGFVRGRPFRSTPAYATAPRLTGVAKDSAGTPIPGAFVRAHRSWDGAPVGETTADGSGAFSIPVYVSGPYQIVAYLAGAPDRAGVSRNDLIAT